MEKYIKADTILKFINGCLEHEDKITDTEKVVLTGVKTCVERIPATDVVEVRHGQWILDQNLTFVGEDFGHWNCSECGYEVMFGNKQNLKRRYLYCPKCGAKLDGGQEND